MLSSIKKYLEIDYSAGQFQNNNKTGQMNISLHMQIQRLVYTL